MTTQSRDFIRTIIDEHQKAGTYGGQVVTRFPPEPNGYLHIGHAKSICLNFGLAGEYRGVCHLRFDDTDPIKEESHFEEAIKETVHWLGFDWGKHLYHASDYFGQLYDLALQLIKQGDAYVCDLTLEQIRETRGTVTSAGENSPYRDRSIEENLDLFARMRAGEFADGEKVLRAKIDMAAANMKMRDPVIYRIRHVAHHMTGDKWCIYPMYDFTHPLSDAIEGITHSICTLEFENNREFYDWIVNKLDMPSKPKQYEFARLNINYTVMSKRKILQLVKEKHVGGWDDPRLLTLAGLRRRGYTPEAIRKFCASVGIAKANSTVDMAQLEFTIRDDLNTRAPRVLAVLDPLKITITNYPEEKEEVFDAPYFPEDVGKEGSRPLPFCREILIERNDFNENPPKGYYRLAPGKEVRLRHGYIIRCDEVVKDSSGDVVELKCSYDEATPLGQNPSDGRKVKGTIHWVSQQHGIRADIRAYDRLFTVENPGAGEHENFLDYINPDSLIDYPNAIIEPSLKGAQKESHYQFERHGYFVTDLNESTEGYPVFNRTVTLKDSWTKQSKQETPKASKPKSKPAQPTKPGSRPQLNKAQQERVQHYQTQYELTDELGTILALNPVLADYFDEATALYPNFQAIANWVVNDIARELKHAEDEKSPVSAQYLVDLVKSVDDGEISSKIAKEVFVEMVGSGQPAGEIIESKGLKQISGEDVLCPIVKQVVADNPDVIEQIRGGRPKKIGVLVGKIMKATGGKANPEVVNRLLDQELA